MTVFTVIYLAGIAACGIQGAEKARKINMHLDTGPRSLVAFFSSFGGGLLRDLFVLCVCPAVFAIESIPDVATAIIAAAIYVKCAKRKRSKNFLDRFSVLADACGLGTFIAMGVDKALAMKMPILIIISCGAITSVGGGLVSSILCGASVDQVLLSNVAYRMGALFGSILYTRLVMRGVEVSVAQYTIILYTLVSALACNRDVRCAVFRYVIIARKQNIMPFGLGTSWTIVVVLQIMWKHNYGTERILVLKCRINRIMLPAMQRSILFHRIRQM